MKRVGKYIKTWICQHNVFFYINLLNTKAAGKKVLVWTKSVHHTQSIKIYLTLDSKMADEATLWTEEKLATLNNIKCYY